MRILQITNFAPRQVVDGGTSREEALVHFFAERGASRLVVQDEQFRGSKLGRVMRLRRLMREVREANPDIVVLSYPAYPFFWQHKISPYLAMSMVFALLLRREANKHGFQIVVDVMDLPVLQYKDLGFEIGTSPQTLHFFNRFVFSRADYLWICSDSLVEVMHQRYGVPQARLISVLNGHSMRFEPRQREQKGPIKFAYAGSLNRERGIGHLIDSFLKSGVANAELHLCGLHGDWIKVEYGDCRGVLYHGSLTDAQACDTLSGCDVGLIPYPEQGYYHLAFATKLPFYMALGLPVLCSNVHETGSHIVRLGVGLCWDINDFAAAFASLCDHPDQIAGWRKRLLEVRSEYSWTSIYSRALQETMSRTAIGGIMCG